MRETDPPNLVLSLSARKKVALNNHLLTSAYRAIMPKRDITSQQETLSPLKHLREQANLTQEQLAYRLGVAVSTIRRWERGGVEPSLTIAEWRKLCQIVGTNLNELPEKLSSGNDA